MDDSWLLLTVMFMSLNANTPTMETKETKTQRGLYSHWWNGKYPRVLWEKYRTKKRRQLETTEDNRICKLKTCLMASLYSPSNTSIYRKRSNRNAKKRDWDTKRRKQQTKTRNVRKRNIKETSDGNIKRRRGQTKAGNRNPTKAKTSISSKYTIRHDKQICSTSKHLGWNAR